ncbi:MAG: oligosaccharide flippase family protein [Candidatus Lindowbacteria bacterium]|nr:oligosaccharide flippase family protein [Candidatus Lindowbacteria bacterium]
MSRFSRVGKNIFFYGLGKVYDTAAALVWIALIARYLGRDGFGDYSLIWAVVTMVGIIPEIGLNNVLIREASRNLERTPALLKATVQVRRLLAPVSILTVIGIIYALPNVDPSVRFSACVGSFWILGRLAMGTNGAIFFAYERVEYDTLLTIFHDTVVVLLLFAATKTDWKLIGVVGAMSLAASIGGIFSFIVRRSVFCAAAKKVDPDLRAYILKESLPIGGSRALRLTGNRIDTLILAWLRTSGEVGVYSGVYSLILRMLPSAWA